MKNIILKIPSFVYGIALVRTFGITDPKFYIFFLIGAGLFIAGYFEGDK